MAIRNYGTYSRLRFVPLVVDQVNKVTRLGMRDFTIMNQLKQNVGFTTWKIPPAYAGRPDNISNLFYGTSNLWWVLVGYNGFFHPLQDFYVNRVIKIPSPDGVISTLI